MEVARSVSLEFRGSDKEKTAGEYNAPPKNLVTLQYRDVRLLQCPIRYIIPLPVRMGTFRKRFGERGK